MLYSCQTGFGGIRSFAKQLAKLLNVPVYAPTDDLNFGGAHGVPTSIDNGGTFERFDQPK